MHVDVQYAVLPPFSSLPLTNDLMSDTKVCMDMKKELGWKEDMNNYFHPFMQD